MHFGLSNFLKQVLPLLTLSGLFGFSALIQVYTVKNVHFSQVFAKNGQNGAQIILTRRLGVPIKAKLSNQLFNLNLIIVKKYFFLANYSEMSKIIRGFVFNST